MRRFFHLILRRGGAAVPQVANACRSLSPLLVAAALTIAGCSGGGEIRASGSPSNSPTSSSHASSPTSSPTPDAQQIASRAAYAAYVGFLNDITAVVNSTRSDTDPRLGRHAASTGIALAAQSVDHFVANHLAIRGEDRADQWRPASFYPATGSPVAVLAMACLDSSHGRLYDIRTGKEQKPLAGHQRVPVTVRVQVDRGVWKVVDANSDFNKTC
jgi:hypothetical protein